MKASDHFACGCIWYVRGELDLAIAEFDEAIRHFAIARQRDIEKDLLDVDPQHRRMIRGYLEQVGMFTDYREVQCYLHRGDIWFRKCEYDQAIVDFTEAIVLDPKEPEPRLRCAEAMSIAGEYEGAIREYSVAITFNYHLIRAYKGRAFAQNRECQFQEAVANYYQAIRLERNGERFFGCFESERSEQEEHYLPPIRIDTEAVNRRHVDDPELYDAFAWLRATCPDRCYRNAAQAIFASQLACELTAWNNVFYLETLSAAHADAGDFENAVRFLDQASELAPNENNAKRNRMRKAFRAHEAYVDDPRKKQDTCTHWDRSTY